MSELKQETRAVIADRTAYDVRYTPTGKLSNLFRLQFHERLVLVRTIRFNRVYERTQTLSNEA